MRTMAMICIDVISMLSSISDPRYGITSHKECPDCTSLSLLQVQAGKRGSPLESSKAQSLLTQHWQLVASNRNHLLQWIECAMSSWTSHLSDNAIRGPATPVWVMMQDPMGSDASQIPAPPPAAADAVDWENVRTGFKITTAVS
jgi:hypothetical protein